MTKALDKHLLKYEQHRLSHIPEYSNWQAMKSRCYNTKNKKYPRYGGRGIKVCDKWFNSFEAFYSDMGPRPTTDHTIDRINNDGNYKPSNCKWSTPLEQAYNRENNVLGISPLTGETNHLLKLSEELGINKETIRSRIKNGRPLDIPVQVNNKEYNYNGTLYKLDMLANFAKVPKSILRDRLRSGWDVSKAVESPMTQTPTYKHKGKTYTLPEIAKLYGFHIESIRKYLARGVHIDDAINKMVYNIPVPLVQISDSDLFEWDGNYLTVDGLSEHYKIPKDVILARMARGEKMHHVMNPIFRKENTFKFEGNMLTIRQIATITGLSYDHIQKRISRGATAEEAVIALRNKNI